MCGRMNISDHEGLQEFMLELGLPVYQGDWQANYNIAPSEQVIVLLADPDHEGSALTVTPMQWGIIPAWAAKSKNKKSFRPLINARAETIWEKPSFRDSVRHRRAIIFVNGFYEWKRESDQKTAYYIKPGTDKGLMLGAIYANDNNSKQQCLEQVSSYVNNARNKGPQCIEPAGL